MPMANNVAVVLAGGVGERMGLGVPKQLIRLGGITLLERSIATFSHHPEVDTVLVVMTPSHLSQAREIAAGYAKVAAVLAGGTTRNSSTEIALAQVGDDETRVLFHDAVRPLVSDRIISSCYATLAEYDAVDVAAATPDTIVEVDDNDVIVSIPRRSSLRRGQTPQGFRAGTLRRAYAAAARDPHFHATDDCGVVLAYLPEVAIKVVEGDARNLKVTDPTDVYLAERLLQMGEQDLRETITRDHL